MQNDDEDRTRLPRLSDVARLAGVSSASADRVLHRRGGVRSATIQRVLEAAATLRYVPDGELAQVAPVTQLRVAFLLPAGTSQYISLLGNTIRAASGTPAAGDAICDVSIIRSFNPELLAQHLLRQGSRADAVAFLALEHPAVREAVNQLAERGVPTITLISDLGNSRRVGYLGLDNRAAGRTAGYLIARFIGARPASVAVIAGSLSYRAHEEREMGFLHLFAELAPWIKVIGSREGHDDDTKNYRQVRMLLSQYPDLAGIYNIGGGASGIARALKEARRDQSVVFVGHGLTQDSRTFLLDGTMDAAITQDPDRTLRACLRMVSNVRAGRRVDEGTEPMRSEIVFRENLPN